MAPPNLITPYLRRQVVMKLLALEYLGILSGRALKATFGQEMARVSSSYYSSSDSQVAKRIPRPSGLAMTKSRNP